MSTPSAPRLVTAPWAKDQTLSFFWDYPLNNGGANIQGYRFTVQPDNIIYDISVPLSNYYTIGGLNNGSTYTVSIQATNDGINYGPSATWRPFQPGFLPDYQVANISSFRLNNTEMMVTWESPAILPIAPLLGYYIETISTNPADPVYRFSALPNQTSYRIGNLNSNSGYRFVVRPVNAPGYGPPSVAPEIRFYPLTDPSIFYGLELWLDASDASTITTSGSNVTRWADKSSYQRPTTISANRPTLLTGALNSSSTIQFSAISTTSVLAGLTQLVSTGNITMISVWKTTSTATQAVTGLGGFTGVAGTLGLGFNQTNGYNLYDVGANEARYAATLTNQWTIESGQRQGGQLFMTLNGYAPTSITGASSTNFNTSTITVGAGPGFYTTGEIAETLVYRNTLTPFDRQKVEGYLASKWGLLGSLNPAHPFKSGAPIGILPFQPNLFSNMGLSLWLDASDPQGTGVMPTIGRTGSTLTTWVDKSPSSNIVTAPAPGTLQVASRNSMVSLFLDGTQFYTVAHSSLSTSYTVFSVFQTTSNTTTFQRVLNSSNVSTFYLGTAASSSTIATFVGNGTAWNDITSNAPGVSALNRFSLVSLTNNGTTLSPFVDGSAQTTKIGTTAPFSNFLIGRDLPNTQPLRGNIGEIMVFRTVLTTDNRQTVEGYLAWKWGLQSNLPDVHPYKFRNPNIFYSSSNVIPDGTEINFIAANYTGSGTWSNLGANGPGNNASTFNQSIFLNSTSNGLTLSNTYLEMSNIGTMSSFTMMAWYKRAGLNNDGALLSDGYDNVRINMALRDSGSGARNAFIGGFHSNGWSDGGTVIFPLNTWVQMAVTWDNSTKLMRTYSNAQLINTNIYPGRFPGSSGGMYFIGRRWDGGSIAGDVGQVVVYDRPLNSNDILYNYNATAPLFPQPPTPPTVLAIHLVASSYSGTGNWANQGTLGSNYNATVFGSPSKNTAGNGIVFNANTQFRFPAFGPLPTYTQSIWFKRYMYTQTMMAQIRTDRYTWTAAIYGNNYRGFLGRIVNGNNYAGGIAVDTNVDTWYNITIVWDGIIMYTYLNGVLQDQATLLGYYSEQSGQPFVIGANQDGSYEFRGEIGEVRMYNGALDASGVLAIYNSTVANYPQTPVSSPTLLLQFTASTYSGTGNWTNTGTLGTAYNAIVEGTPSKNSDGNGIVFNANLRYRFPSFGFIKTYTQSVWFRRNLYSTTIWSQQNHWTQNAGPFISANIGRLFYGRFRSAGNDIGGGGIETDIYTWYNLVIVFDGTYMYSYLNGVLKDTAYLGVWDVEATDYNWYIGADYNPNTTFRGELGEVRFYNGALDASGVLALYNSTVATYPNTTIPTDMILQFTASTYSGFGNWTNTGTLGTAYNGVVEGTPSKNTAGNGIVFNANLRYRFPSFGWLRTYTQSVWFKRTLYSTAIMAQQTHWSQNAGPFITANNGRLFYGRFRVAGNDIGGAGIQTDVNTWYNLTIVFDGTAMYSYLNGVLQDTALLPSWYVEATDYNWYIGADYNPSTTFRGELGEVRMYNGALDASGVLAIYNSTVANYPNVTPPTEMLIQFAATNYTGTGDWPNTGTLGAFYNAVVNSGTPSKSGTNAVVFNSTTTNLTFRFPAIGPLPRYTQSVWLRRTGNSGSIISQQSHYTGNAGPYISANNSSMFYGRFRTANSDYGGNGIEVALNTWVHLVITYDGSTMVSYLNGVVVDTTTINGGYVETTENNYFIGADLNPTASFIGNIGEIRIYNGVLDASGVLALYNSTASTYSITPTPPTPPTINMLVRFTASTYSGSGAWSNTGTLGSANDASVHTGTPVKNSAGNGVVFNSNLVFKFPTVGNQTSYTMVVWLKRGFQSRNVLTQQWNGSGNMMAAIEPTQTRFFFHRIVTGNNYYAGPNVETSLDTWTHLVFTRNSTAFTTYVNGQLRSINYQSGITITNNTAQFFIGGDWNGGASFIGEIGEVRFYSGALDNTQVLQIYNDTVATYPNSIPVTDLEVQYTASTYSGTGSWPNTGILGASYDGVVHTGTPVKNSAGNGVVFNRNLVYRFPTVGSAPRWTMVFWLKRTGLARNLFVQQYTGSQSQSPWIEGGNGRQFYGRHYYNQNYYSGNGIDLDVNTWYHVAVVWNGFTMTNYVNGTLRNYSILNGVYAEQNGAQYFLGGDWNGGAQFEGELGEMRFYNGPLTADQIASQYAAGLSTYPNPAPVTEMKVCFTASTYSGSGNWTNTGTLGSAWNAVPTGTIAKNSAGNGIVFNLGQRFAFPSIGSLSSYTVSLWIKRTGLPRIVMSQQNNGTNFWIANILPSGRSFYLQQWYNGNWGASTNSLTLDVDKWYMMTFVWDGQAQTLAYLNGALQATNTPRQYPEQNGAQYFIGADRDANYSFQGEIGELRMYNGVLSATEIATIYNDTVATYPNPAVTTNMLVCFTASTYSGSGNWTNTGTLGSGWNAVPTGTITKNSAGNGIIFNATQVFTFPNIGNLPSYTQSMWIKRTFLARTAMSQRNTNGQFWVATVESTGYRTFDNRLYWFGNWQTSASVELDIDTWYMVTFVWDSTTFTVTSYLNGTVQDFVIRNGVFPEQSGGEYRIGANWEAGNSFIGEIGEVRMYNGALQPPDIYNIYASTYALYPNVIPATEMKIRFTASTYSGSGNWTNTGTLGSANNAVPTGTPSKNGAGNGIVFNANLRFQFPNIGNIPRYTQFIWLKRTGTAGTVMAGQNQSNIIPLLIEGDGSTSFYGRYYYNQQWYGGQSYSFNTNQWYNLVIVWESNRMSTYLDGTLMSITTLNGIYMEQNGGVYFIGANWDQGNTFRGEIGEIRIYNGVLSATEIANLYNETVRTYNP